MAWTEDLYSNFVGWMKVLLPLAALALLSTIFLFARGSNNGQSIPYAELAAMAREQGMSDPNLAGVMTDGSAVSITADSLRPDPDSAAIYRLQQPRLSVTAPDGSSVEMTAGEGWIDAPGQMIRLTDLVRLETSAGYLMETSGVETDLSSGRISSLGPLEVQAPFGTMRAGQVVVQTSRNGVGQQMVFNGGVSLLYQPQP